MSSDGYFDGNDDFDEEALGQLDAIAAAHFSPPKKLHPIPFPASTPPLSAQDSFYDLSLDVDENELAQLDNFIQDAYQGRAQPVAVAGPSQFSRSTSSNKLQTTLFGDVIQPVASSTSNKGSTMERTKSVPRNPFGQRVPKTKKWDQTAFAKSGPSKGKGKGKARQADDDEDGEDPMEFEQFPNPLPPPFVPSELLGFHPFERKSYPCLLQLGKQHPDTLRLKS
jgi:ATP-dependent DNA helicase MPH1